MKHLITEKTESPLDIRWNALDGIIAIAFVAIMLVGVYFGSAKVLVILGDQEFLNTSTISNVSFSILYGIQVILMFGVVWFFAIFWRKSRFKDLGLRYYSIAKTLWYSLILLIAIFVISFLYVFIMNALFGIEAPSSKMETLIKNSSVSNIILLLVVAFIGPIIEEIFFRGFIYSAFKKSWGTNVALFLSSLLFAIVHLDLFSLLPLTIIGWLLAYLYQKTKSLLPAIFLHAVYNLILILIMLGQLEVIKLY